MTLKTRSPLGYMRNRSRYSVAHGAPSNTVTKTRWQFISRSRLIAEASMLLIWLVLWIANGIATASGVVLLGLWLKHHGVWQASGVLDWFFIGCLAHVVISFVGQHLWRGVRIPAELRIIDQMRYFVGHVDRMRLTFAVLVGSIDAFSTAWYLHQFVTGLFGYRVWLAVPSGLVAALVALSAEPMIRQFVRGIQQVMKGEVVE
jgi:hypothetical protein